MGDISKNFSRYEFACSDGCGFNVVDAELITVLEDIRGHFGESVAIESGARCKNKNATLPGSAPGSQHLLGKAADIRVTGIHPSAVAAYIDAVYPGQYGLGRYETFTHIDVRTFPARW